MTKQTIRRSLLKKRQSMSLTEWRQKSDRLVAHLQTSPLLLQAETILAYSSFRQEPDISPLFSNRKSWGFPRCVGKSLSWHICYSEELQKGTYGILEPPADAPILQPSQADIILVPAVACDLRGYRLGYGGGFYDRMLSLPEWATKPTIGIVFEFAFLPELPTDIWDRPLNGICTEEQLTIFNHD